MTININIQECLTGDIKELSIYRFNPDIPLENDIYDVLITRTDKGLFALRGLSFAHLQEVTEIAYERSIPIPCPENEDIDDPEDKLYLEGFYFDGVDYRMSFYCLEVKQ